MIRNSVVLKLWLTIIALVVVVLALLSVFLEQLFDSYFYRWQTDSLVNRAAYINDLVIREPQPIALKIADELAKESGSQIYVVGSPETDPNAVALLKSLSSEQLAQLQEGQPIIHRGPESGIAHLKSETESLWVLYPFIRGNLIQGLLLIHQPVTVTLEAIQRIRELVLFSMGLGIAMTTGLAFVVSKNLSRPVIQMNEVAERMAEGDFRGKVNVVTGDEVGQLGHTLNTMANRMEENILNLSKEKEQLAGILTSMTDGVVSADLNGRVTLANPPARRWLRGLQLAQTGITSEDMLPKELLELQKDVLSSRDTLVVEEVWQGRSIVLTMTPLYEPGEESLRGVVAVFRDVTEERRLDSLRKDFVANVSHELRTPLAMMQGYSEALLDEFGDDPEQRNELTQIILDETHRMRRLVNALLDLAQLESGEFQMTETDVNLGDLVTWTVRKFSTLANERNIQLIKEIPSHELFVIMGDTDRMEQVLTNLVDNAIRHTPNGGTVRLTLDEEGHFYQISVTDTGEGIPEDDLPFIFERFYKADKARTRSKGGTGTGIGLSIAKNIVLKHQGDIHVASREGKGTVFTILLPKQHENRPSGL